MTFGNYRIESVIGEGGMGTVYRALRDDGQFEQTVALKVIRAGVSSTERSILAQLRHPYIAQIIDGGEQDGLSYLVLEFVAGKRIDAFCRDWPLSLKERIVLFLKVCEAVQHAHAALIVHLDLKPSNILVTADGVPKLLDFGIAKLLSDAANPSPELRAPMTPHYASPEQLAGEPITIASDVYSLGVVLSELVVGQAPEDLDNILSMAMRPEPGRRYRSVAQFAEDLKRYLDGLTVIARPDTLSYRWSKFVKRNRLPLVLAALLFLAVTVATAFVLREGARSQRRFGEVRNLASSILNEIDPEAAKVVGSTTLRRMMIEKSLTYLDRLAADASEDQDLQMELGRAYHLAGDIQGNVRTPSLGLFNESLESHLKGIAIEERLPKKPAVKNQLAWGYAHIAELYSRRGDSVQALSLVQRAYALVDRSSPASYIDVCISLNRILYFEGRLEEALTAIQSAIGPALQSKNPHRGANVLRWASETAFFLGRIPLASDYTNQALQLLESRSLNEIETVRLHTLYRDRGSQLSQAFSPNQEHHCEAIADLQRGAEGQMQVHLADPKSINRLVQIVTALQMLSTAQALCGKPEAIDTVKRAIAIYNSDKKRVNPELDLHLAFAFFKLGHNREARNLLEQQQHPDAQALQLLAELALAEGRSDEARRQLAEARRLRQPTLNAKTFERLIFRYQQAQNIRLALQAGDTTPGLRQQGLQLLEAFGSDGLASSIEHLRRDLHE